MSRARLTVHNADKPDEPTKIKTRSGDVAGTIAFFPDANAADAKAVIDDLRKELSQELGIQLEGSR